MRLAAAEQGGEVLLGSPVSLAVGRDGTVYVLDQMMGHVVRLHPSGATDVMGRRGAGPGEFMLPMTLAVDGDTLRVDDRGNRRIQVLTSAGTYVRSYPVPVRASASAAFGPGGLFIHELQGASGRLAGILDNEGQEEGTVGDAPAAGAAAWNFRRIKEEIDRGRVPDVLRNAVKPALGPDGAAWLVLTAEGRIERHDRGGGRSTAALRGPETDGIRKQFFERNRMERSPSAFYPLSLAADAAAIGEELWVLLRAPETAASVVLVYGRDAALLRRWTFPDVRGARSLAPDPERGKLHFAIPSDASILSIDLPSPSPRAHR